MPSLRYYAFAEAISDLRALQLLESLSSREEALNVLKDALNVREIAFGTCPASEAAFIELRKAINRAVESHLK